MKPLLRPTLTILTIAIVGLGVVYPAFVTAFALLVFPLQAEGSIVVVGEKRLGSALLGQPFSRPEDFWGRPSATLPFEYNASASTGSNFGPSNPAMLAAVKTRIDKLHSAEPSNVDVVPIDLVTASGSGLDPDISESAAYYQATRVAANRGIPVARVQDIIRKHVRKPFLGLFGESHVNVLELNLAIRDLEADVRQ